MIQHFLCNIQGPCACVWAEAKGWLISCTLLSTLIPRQSLTEAESSLAVNKPQQASSLQPFLHTHNAVVTGPSPALEFLFMCVGVSVGVNIPTHLPQHPCGGQRTTSRSLFFGPRKSNPGCSLYAFIPLPRPHTNYFKISCVFYLRKHLCTECILELELQLWPIM